MDAFFGVFCVRTARFRLPLLARGCLDTRFEGHHHPEPLVREFLPRERSDAPRLERLLLALTVAYTLAVLLGAGPAARRVRADCEILRTGPGQGTRGRLRALSVGILLLSLSRFAAFAAGALTRMLAALARGTLAVALAICPP